MPFPYSPGEELYEGLLRLGGSEQDWMHVSAVEGPGHPIWLYVDLNRSGTLDKGETFRFRRLKHDPRYEQEVKVDVPLQKGPFRSFEIRFVIPRRGMESVCEGFERAVLAEDQAVVMGETLLDGRKLRAAWYYSPADGTVRPESRQGVDSNFDGRVNFEATSPESDFGESPIFRIGDRYFSTGHVDLAAGTFKLRERGAGEYTRIEMVEGTRLPEFTFQDFDGVNHPSSEYRGRWLLIHFWEYPCSPCFADFPYLRQAWDRLHSRGLEILGIDGDVFSPEALKAAQEQRAVWPQARGESLSYFKGRLRLWGVPTSFLVDPQGRIAVVNRWPVNVLRGEELLRTLHATLPLGPLPPSCCPPAENCPPARR
jgi:hypothetical protein